jgi:tRNA/tmRNA/rRNA uracil-C5-methylase (TrmA/RlmC/RlmD family)
MTRRQPVRRSAARAGARSAGARSAGAWGAEADPTGAGGAGAGRARSGPWQGREIELDVGSVAHGGHCVARAEGRVVFVRHALPGERVVARVTEDAGGSYCRADAVRVLTASPDRVDPPCPHAGPGRCGGCDWQHATGAAQRAGKAAVLREQLARLAGLPGVPVVVEPLSADLLGWRTRVRFAVGPDGRTGLRRHRSHDLEPVRRCPLGTDAVAAAGVGERRWPPGTEVEVVASTGGDTAVLRWAGGHRSGEPAGRAERDRQPTGAGRDGARYAGRARRGPVLVTGPDTVREVAGGRAWRVSATGFWQVHPAAADALAGCVLDFLRPAPGETALDLYAGAGLFAGLLAAAVGPAGRVVAVEADPRAAADAAANVPGIEVRAARVTPGLLSGLGLRPDVVVLDPPRAGAGTAVLTAVLALAPRAVAYVACDPAALARDLRVAVDAGWALRGLRAFDLFPMTHHVEAVALLGPTVPATEGAPDRPPED